MRSFRFFAVLLAVSVVLAPAAGAEPTEVGTTAATNTDTRGTPPRMATRNLFIGTNVFFEERIETSKTGQAQLLFLDESALTIASNSDVVIDKFIYDPKTSKGELALSLGAGLFRFVGGRISKTAGVTIKTPTATIGIRGGIAIIKVEPGTGETRATWLFGKEMTVTNKSGVTIRVTRPGFAVDVASKDEEPSSPGKVSGDEIAGNLTELEGRTGQTAGLTEPLTDDQVADSGIDDLGSSTDPDTIVGEETAATGGTDVTDGVDPELPPIPNLESEITETNPTPSPSRTLNGFSGGVLLRSVTPSISLFGKTNDNPADIRIITDAANGTVKAEFDVFASSFAVIVPPSEQQIVAVFGGTGETSVFIDDTSFSITDPNATATIGGVPATTASLTLKTSDLAGLDGVEFCQCEFLQWGIWDGFFELTSGDDLAAILAYWVAGEIPALLDMPVSGTATYSGHVIGNVVDGTAGGQDVVGNFSMDFNFATPASSTGSITNFDLRDYDLGVVDLTAGSTGLNVFTGDITGNEAGELSALGIDGNFTGSFMQGGGDPAAEIGGGFKISDGNAYEASGIFAGSK